MMDDAGPVRMVLGGIAVAVGVYCIVENADRKGVES